MTPDPTKSPVNNPSPCFSCDSLGGQSHCKPILSVLLVRERRRQQLPLNEYTIRVSNTMWEKCGTIRATFIIKMPDFFNPTTEFWVLRFCCDIHRLDSDMKSITSCCYPEMGEVVSGSIRGAVEGLLQALEKDTNSVPLNKDFQFYPNCSDELVSIIGRNIVTETIETEDCDPSGPTGAPDDEDEDTITVKVPAHAQQLVCRLAKHLWDSNKTDPIIIMPSSTKTAGHLLHLPDHPSFLCSWDGVDCGFGLYFLPNYKNFIVVQGRNFMGPNITIFYPPRSGLLAITPSVRMNYIQKLTVANPKNLAMPLLELPLPESPTTPLNFDEFVFLVMTLRESFTKPNSGISSQNSRRVPMLSAASQNTGTDEKQSQYEIVGSGTSFLRGVDGATQRIAWTISDVGTQQFGSFRGYVTLPPVVADQGVPFQQGLPRTMIKALPISTEKCNGQPTSQPNGAHPILLPTQASIIPNASATAASSSKQTTEQVKATGPSPTTSRFRVIRLPESERETNWGLYPESTQEESTDPPLPPAICSIPPPAICPTPPPAPTGIPAPVASLPPGSGHTPRSQGQSKPVARRQSLQYSNYLPKQHLYSPIAEKRPDSSLQQRPVRRTESERVPKSSEDAEKSPCIPPNPNLTPSGRAQWTKRRDMK
ncbi:hypothetical protein ECG_02248 [Echinococcus granulosus]|uniref:Protein kinase n=1 Tax=Echinococcus granulosus TaxID=6210 RepID=A0A068WRU2_ECHGR|nr:hypothetical protein ECG_02248 [Echinococcus granulosus]CDS20376.1 protein kinase [Echinococcus granulosus]